MMNEPSVTYAGEWEGIPLTVTYNPEWLGFVGYIEVRAEEKLPITETGYRSIFLNPDAVTHHGGAVAYVEGLLNEAAQHPQWQRYRQERKQLSLF